MKKNLTKSVTMAIAAIGLCLTASAGPGDLYEIEKLTGGYGISASYPSEANPIINGGQPIRFALHLAAANADTAPLASVTNWYLDYIGPGSQLVDDVMNPLRIGVVVSGKLRWATLVETYVNNSRPEQYDTSHRGCGAIYDAVFEYVVQPGDYAMPLTLALAGSTEDAPISALGGVTSFMFQNDDKWWFRNAAGENCILRLVDSARRSDMQTRNNAWAGAETDLTLASAGFYVRTVNFTDPEPDNWEQPGEYWRSVQNGSGITGRPATLKVNGMPSRTSRLYAWTTNETVVTMSSGTPTRMGLPDDGITSNSFKVATIEIVGGLSDGYVIPLRGVSESPQSVDVFISQYPGFRYNIEKDGSLVPDFLVTKVRCVAAPRPGVKISFDAAASEYTYNAGTTVVAPYDSAMPTPIPMYVTLSDMNGLSSADFPDGVDILINPQLAKAAYAGEDVYSNSYISVSLDPTDSEGRLKSVHFDPGQWQVPIYLFVRGGDTKTASGIKFTPAATNDTFNAAYSGTRTEAKINVRDAVPVLQMPEDGKTLTADAIAGFDLDLQVLDCYRDMMSTNFTVSLGYMSKSGVEFARDVSTKCHFRSPGNSGTYKYAVTVTDQNGNTSTNKVQLTINVTPPKTVEADFVASTSSTNAILGTSYKENSNPTFSKVASGEIICPIPRFRLIGGQNNSGDTLYAFLEPVGETASNKVQCAAFTEGVPIPLYATESEPNDKFRMTFLDGCAETSYLEFRIVLRTKPTLDEGEVYTEFVAPKKVNLSVANVAPEILRLTYNGTPRASGDTVHVADGIPASFTLTLDDASKFDMTNATKRLVTVWRFEDDAGMSEVQYVTNVVGSTVTCTNTFIGGGSLQKVEVYAFDKDMDPETEKGASFLLNVAVDDSPFVYFTTENKWVSEGANRAEEYLVHENAALKQRYLYLFLSAPAGTQYTAARPLKVNVTCTRLGNSGAVTLSKTSFDFKKGDKGGGTSFRITLDNLDGGEQDDSVFQITATPSWNGSTDDCGYIGSSLELTVENVAPVIVKPTDIMAAKTNQNNTAGSTVTIPFKATDVLADTDMTVRIEGLSGTQEANYTNGTDVDLTYTFGDTDIGLQQIIVTARDKDGYETSKTLYYDIPATKALRLTPYGPAKASKSRYNGITAGLGRGEVGSDAGGRATTNEDGRVTFYYPEKASQAEAWACGFPAGAPDGLPDLDSFFYCWVQFGGEGGGLDPHPLAPNPVTSTGTKMKLDVLLDPYEAGKGSYQPTTLEAIFSKEWLPSDNLGDINADGVPDLLVRKLKLDGDGTQPTTTDLDDISEQNDDDDYIPNIASIYVPSNVASAPEEWAANWLKFGVRLEIRGVGDALNDATRGTLADGTRNIACALDDSVMPARIYEDPEADADSTLTKAEWLAYEKFLADGGTPMAWTPERPTDPTMEDTDGDGFPDGYEYYFWYLSHVGYLDDEGKLVQITGHRYNPLSPRQPFLITSEEIAQTMDPLVRNALASDRLDSDNDGLPDLIEVRYTHTNPFEWDTDGDGLPDGYEVMIGLDPCKAATDGELLDGLRNVDGDAMAEIELNGMSLWSMVEKNTGITNWFMAVNGDLPTAAVGEAVTELPAHFFGVMEYGFATNKFVRTFEYTVPEQMEALLNGDYILAEIREKEKVSLIHSDVYQERRFDPRTGWGLDDVCKDTVPYTQWDEFMLMGWYAQQKCIAPGALEPTDQRPWTTIWAEFCTSDTSADMDGDGAPDGWELYVAAGPRIYTDKGVLVINFGPFMHLSPLVNDAANDEVEKALDSDGLLPVAEFCGVSTCAWYAEHSDTPTIVNIHPEWTNKLLATDPWNADTDGDGLGDGEEKGLFAYGAPTEPGAGGGLNPCSWDTDGDGLPDPWEAEFAGSLVEGEATTKTETVVDEATGATNTVTTVIRAAGQWAGGMDGTVDDAALDYDSDGLQNWQEYIAGTLRCWRYDDTVSPWTYSPPVNIDAMPEPADEDAWGKFWYNFLVNEQSEEYNPHLVETMFDNGAPYMSLCTNEWDSAAGKWYYFKDGVYHDLRDPPLRYHLKEYGVVVTYNRFTKKVKDTWRALFIPFDIGLEPIMLVYPTKYICCDPRNPDTDGDGMDDFYELFHGMNPLLGASGIDPGGSGNPPRDLIYEAYGGDKKGSWSAQNNYWNNGADPHADLPLDAQNPFMDFVSCPWLNGLAAADPDGDDIRNQYEAIMPNLQAASTFLHSDPTPLWMTDISYGMSLVNRYFAAEDYSRVGEGVPIDVKGADGFWYDSNEDGEKEFFSFSSFKWFEWDPKNFLLITLPYTYNYWDVSASRSVEGGRPLNYFYSFEQNEGYDTDGDFLGDWEEAMGKTKTASDPLDAEDPRRRQAMYFDGVESLLSHPLAVNENAPTESLGSEARQNYLYYTVECWAKPEDPKRAKPQTLVERTVYSGEANPADRKYIRKNFLIGIRNGRWYCMFDTNGTREEGRVEITDGTEATTNWTHVASTFDGKALRLYVNGVCVKTKTTGFQPEHAATMLGVMLDGTGLSHVYKSTVASYEPVSFAIGASATTLSGIIIDYKWRISPLSPASNFEDDFTDYYKGYIDEVRIWDGALDSVTIADYYQRRVRFTRQEALENRDAVYTKWREGGRRLSAADTTLADAVELPPELMHHWSFDNLPGATKPAWTAKTPTGFAIRQSLVDSRAIWCRPADWVNTWWASGMPVLHSKVYTDYSFVPWIPDTVAHLPRLDRTTLDSVYWSENYVGSDSAVALGYTRFDFPRSAEPYGSWFQVGYGEKTRLSDPTRYKVIQGDANTLEAMRFTLRNRHVEGDDLVPLGNAYPRRISADEGGMWDEQGPADVWAQTRVDNDANFLPDWWENFALTHYGASLPAGTPITWDTELDYFGAKMPAWQAYLRDLARGLLPDKKVHPEYADVMDSDGDKLPDWWENLFGIQQNKATDGMDDPDHDGLSNYQEWLCGEGVEKGFGPQNGYPSLNPGAARSMTDQPVIDYFLTMTNGPYAGWYLGEIFADHDMMEDDEEDVFGTDRTVYDAWSDKDEDGWTAWSELRYATYKMTRVAGLISHMMGSEEIKDAPTPVIRTTLRYNGDLEGVATAPIIVEAYSGSNLAKKPAATYIVTPGESATNVLYLGAWEKRVVHGTMTPGFVQTGLDMITLEGAFIQANDTFSWTSQSNRFYGTYAELRQAMTDDPGVQVNTENFAWTAIMDSKTGLGNIIQISVDEKTQRGYLLFAAERVGTLDLMTGDFTLDLSKLNGSMEGSGIDVRQYIYRLSYYSRTPTMQTRRLTVSLANTAKGSLREGTASFVAFSDVNGDGVFTPGEPIGFTKDVEIGWDKVPELTIELTDASAAAGKRFAYDDTVESLRVIRTAFNGSEYLDEAHTKPVKRRIVYSRDATKAVRNTVFEGDLVAAGKYGLDWAGLQADILAAGLMPKDVTEVSYKVVKNTASVDHIAEENIIDAFTISFPQQQVKPTPVSPSSVSMPKLEAQRPTFIWSAPEGSTAFALEILDAGGKVVWSNTNTLAVLPPRNASGNYVWTAPVFVGRDICDDAWALDNGSNYQWRVAHFSQKFSTLADAAWSDPATFSTALATDNDFSTGYGTAKVAVKYFGPATNDLSDVVVRLYRTADFTGVPAAQTRLRDITGTVRRLATDALEVPFCGLETGDYYAMAFIDRNNNVTRERYETWGYANQIGLSVQAIYTPAVLSVDAQKAKVPSATIYMEDTDVNQDDEPDCLTLDESVLALASAVAATDDGAADADGDGLTTDEEASDTYTDASKWDTDGDGLPDGWEAKFADLDPLLPDAETVADGDAMAYAEVTRTLVTNAAGEQYLLNPTNMNVSVGDDLSYDQLVSTYDYLTIVGSGTNAVVKTLQGVGTNLVANGTTFRVRKIEPVTAVLVHAQVFDTFGFSQKTAVAHGDAVNSKPFTALDKYMLVRYLSALGVSSVSEEAMNRNKLWRDSTLKPGVIDNDYDGIADGWELYVMFGTNTVKDATTMKLSPWNYDDARAISPDGEGLRNIDEYGGGRAPTNPWDQHSMWKFLSEKGLLLPGTSEFTDGIARDFAFDESKRADDDNDLIANIDEMRAYYRDPAELADLSVTNAWSDGMTPDYFRACASSYLGALFNGGEFIEPAHRASLGISDLSGAGTRDCGGTGWDFWSVARAAVVDTNGTIIVTNVAPAVALTLKYAGNAAQTVIVEAYQVSSSHPEYGEQLTAKWTASAAFDSGVAKVTLGETNLTEGSLKQGPARFVAYIDVDGDGVFSAADTYGEAKTEIGYLGADVLVRLGEQLGLPSLAAAVDSNRVQTVAIVRTKVNGKRLEMARGVKLRKFENNLSRLATVREIYLDAAGDFVGIDPYLAEDIASANRMPAADAAAVESVTYEIIRIPSALVGTTAMGSAISVTNLNHYTYQRNWEDADGNETNETITVDQNVNEEFTIHYSSVRDVSTEVVAAPAEDGAIALSFAVPTDTFVDRYWVNLAGEHAHLSDVRMIESVADGKVVIDDLAKSLGVTLPAGEYTIEIGLGNDKFTDSPDGTDGNAWSAKATFTIAGPSVRDGKLAVQVKHPVAADASLAGRITVAAYEKADLVNPVATVTAADAGDTIEIPGLRAGRSYYVAAWYVNDAADGRTSAKQRLPYDTWGYLTALGVSTNGFDATSVRAEGVPSMTNTVWLQDTDFNDNGIADRTEALKFKAGRTDAQAPEALDCDLDGVLDVDDEDPVFDNSKDALEYDVMAYAQKKMFCVRIGTVNAETNWVWYLVTDIAKETTADKLDNGEIYIPKGTKASELKTLAATYLYGRKKNSPYGLGTNVTLTAGQVYDYEWKDIVLVHDQVYRAFGFNPYTANGLCLKKDRVNTKSFDAIDKYIVTNYLVAVGAIAPDAEMANWVLKAKVPDFDFDGIPDGWELYTMFGTNAVKRLDKTAKTDVLNAWVAGDRNNDADADGLTNLHEYNGGQEPSDPWNAYAIYDNLASQGLVVDGTAKFKDAIARRFGLTIATANDDSDGDLIANIDEMRAYYRDPTELADLSVTNAWSDGATPDYFRACGSTYLGALFNGGEFIEPERRAALGMAGLVHAGTRDYAMTGWDFWSVARTATVDADGTITVTNVAPAVTLSLKYAGNAAQTVIVEAHQVSSAYAEYGEQLSARWTVATKFDAGVAKVTLDETNLTEGSLKQGPVRFLAYIDMDGDGVFSAADTYGEAKTEIGYLGADVTIRLGEANLSLPFLALAAEGTSNDVQTIAIVRTKVNGKQLTKVRGVKLRRYVNNVNREVLFPEMYFNGEGEFEGLDPFLADDIENRNLISEADAAALDSVTYEIVRLSSPLAYENSSGLRVSVTNLNHYTYEVSHKDPETGATSNETFTVDQDVNETFTVRYSLERDVALNVVAKADNVSGATLISFTVPKDRAVTCFWFEIDDRESERYILPPAADGVVVFNPADYGDVFDPIPGEHTVRIGLGNDKFAEPPDDFEKGNWSATATFGVGAAAARNGRLAVDVRHPMTNFTGGITVAAYENADLVNPVVVTNGCKSGVVELKGLRTGRAYYVAAWYVKNASDGRASVSQRKPYDTWGYLTALGVSPNGFNVASVRAEGVPTVTNMLWMQDTDFNDNGLADREESFASVNGKTDVVGPDPLDYDFDGIIDVDDPDPVFDNSGDVLESDVMAYATVNHLCVQVGAEDSPANLVWYVVDDPSVEPSASRLSDGKFTIARGTSASSLKTLFTTYPYGRKLSAPIGLGTNVTLTAGRVYSCDYKDVILVHSQVYRAFGFNPKTANPAVKVSEWVNTKQFTSLDKYIVTNYYAATGALPAGTAWRNWTLSAKYADCDFDGITDGWELYTMFGPSASYSMAAAPHWPNRFADRAADADSDGLDLLHEYDNGENPTDPWNADSDGDGIPDAHAQKFGLKGERYRDDDDNDGLSNFQEYLSSVVLTNAIGSPVVDPERMLTYAADGQVVPDYFLRVGSLYLGEILGDHDFIEDWLEDSGELFVGDRRASRFQYDAHRDDDGNGWDNWSEARAFFAAGRTNVVEYVTNDTVIVKRETSVSAYSGRPTPTGRIKVIYNGEKYKASLGDVVVKAYRYRDGNVPRVTEVSPDAIWTVPATGTSDWYSLGVSTNGFVCGGMNLFEVFMDANRDGAWTPGEPYGVIDDVDVGFASIPDSIVEVTDCHPSMIRLDLASALAANSAGAQATLNDRGVNGFSSEPNASVIPNNYQNPLEASTRVRVRLVRYQANLQSSYYNAAQRKTFYVGAVLLDTYIDVAETMNLTEAVLPSIGKLDLDWGTDLATICREQNFGSLSKLGSLSYGFVVGEEDFLPSKSLAECNCLATVFVNAFETGGEQTPATPIAVAFEGNGSRPTFKWRHDQSRKSYPAFRLRVWDDGTVVYDSGAQRAPVRRIDGAYQWIAPAYVGDQLENDKDYTFTVSMLDAKFTEPNAAEAKWAFRTEVSGLGGALSDQYSVYAAVKYFGPVATNAPIRVEAFTSPDFAGLAASATTVKNVATLMATNALTCNAQLIGLDAGRPYYIRAYIDSNENGRKDADESWGYGNYVGTERQDIYTPRAYVANRGSFLMPEAVVFIEDVDRNNNGLPDVTAVDQSAPAPVTGPYVIGYDGTSGTAMNIFAAMGGDAALLPFVSQLNSFANGQTLSAFQMYYAMAMFDLDPAGLSTEPVARITNFDLARGIEIALETPTTVNGGTLLAKKQGMTISVNLTVTVWHVADLTGAWAPVGAPIAVTVPVNTQDGKVPPANLAAINAEIATRTGAAAGFFKVTVEVAP